MKKHKTLAQQCAERKKERQHGVGIVPDKIRLRKTWANLLQRKIRAYCMNNSVHPLVSEQLRQFIRDMETEPATERLKTGFG